MERNFKGIWIPKEIWLSKDLTLQEKVFLVEISSLDNEEGCFASNGYFSEFFKLSKSRTATIINDLVRKGYLTSKLIYKKGSKQVEKRILKVVCNQQKGISDMNGGISEIGFDTSDLMGGYFGNEKDNNISNNTGNNTNNKTYTSGDIFIKKLTTKELLIDGINNLDVSQELKLSFINYLEYRILLKKPWKTMIPINSAIKNMLNGEDFKSEKHLIDSMEYSMENEWLKIVPTKIDTVSKNLVSVKQNVEGFKRPSSRVVIGFENGKPIYEK